MKFMRLLGPVALLSFVALVGATIAGLLLVPAEASLPVHWGVDGKADAFWPRNFALLMPPLVLAAVLAVMALVVARGKDTGGSLNGLRAGLAAIGLAMAAIQSGSVAIALGYPVDMVRLIAFVIGFMLIGLGNVMPKSQPNSYSGFRLRWTLESPANWQATNRFAGVLMMLGGVVIVLAALFFPHPAWLLAAIVAGIAVPTLSGIIYSYRYAQKERARRPA